VLRGVRQAARPGSVVEAFLRRDVPVPVEPPTSAPRRRNDRPPASRRVGAGLVESGELDGWEALLVVIAPGDELRERSEAA
jgi:hypothetical protein